MAGAIRLGLLVDIMGNWGLQENWERIARFVADEAERANLVHRPIEFVVRAANGLPHGETHAVVQAWHELVDEGVLAIMGPCMSDNVAAVQDHVETRRVPTIFLGATARLGSPHGFSVQWGSIPEDAYLLANWLSRQGHRNIALAWDGAWHSGEYVEHFRVAAERYGLKIRGEERVTMVYTGLLGEQSLAAVTSLRQLDVDALAYMGTGAGCKGIAMAVQQLEWDIPRIANGGFFAAMQSDEARRALEGWVGTSVWDDQNAVLSSFLEQYRQSGGQVVAELGAILYDGARALVHGAALAPLLTRDGVRQGLERLKVLPSACGGPRTLLGFSPYDHRGLKGPDLMVLRRIRDGESVMEGHFA